MSKTKTDKQSVYTVDEIKKRAIPVFRENNIKKAVLFGSYAGDAAHRKSDIDILVDSARTIVRSSLNHYNRRNGYAGIRI